MKEFILKYIKSAVKCGGRACSLGNGRIGTKVSPADRKKYYG